MKKTKTAPSTKPDAVFEAPIDGNLAKATKATKTSHQNKTNPGDEVMNNAVCLAGGVMVGKVPVSMIDVDASYQRYLRPHHVAEIQATWDIRKSGFLMVNYRDGKFIAMDGMHRLEVAKNKGVEELNCVIYNNLTVAEEARVFAEQNERTLRISVHDKFRARVVGDGVFEKQVLELCKVYSVDTDPIGRNQPGGLSALGTAIKIVQRQDFYYLNLIFRLIQRLGWHTVKGGYSRTVLLAAERLLMAAEKKEEVINTLTTVFGHELSTPKDHIRVANAAYPTAESDTEALANYWKEKALK